MLQQLRTVAKMRRFEVSCALEARERLVDREHVGDTLHALRLQTVEMKAARNSNAWLLVNG